MSRVHNEYVHALSTLGSKVKVSEKAVDMKIVNKAMWVTVVDLIPIDSLDEQDWVVPHSKLKPTIYTTMARKRFKDFVIVNGEFTIEVVMEYWLKVYHRLTRKQNYIEFMIFYVEGMISSYIDAFKANDFLA